MKNVKNIVTVIIIVIVFLATEAVFIHWNTNKFLMTDAVLKDVTPQDTSYVGRRAEGGVETVTTLAQIEEKSYVEAYFFKADTLEPTGVYKLLSVEYEGIVRKGKTYNIFPREMFTTDTFLPTVYRGMYGQFYIAGLEDGSKVLVLIGCNDEKAALRGEYENILAAYATSVVIGKEANYRNEASEQIERIEADMDLQGYINLGDDAWAKRHDFGLFVMSALKALLAICIAGIAAGIVSVLIWKE